MTNSIMSLVNKKSKLYKKMKLNPTTENTLEYTQLRNRLGKIIDERKMFYHEKLTEEKKFFLTNLWKNKNNLTKKSEVIKSVVEIVKIPL